MGFWVATPICPASPGAPDQEAPTLEIEIIGQKEHDPRLFTQGLFLDGGLLYESSGLYGRSAFYVWDVRGETPLLKKAVSLPNFVFAEGASLAGEEIYILTWKEGGGFVLDKGDLKEKRRFRYQGEGWGLCHDGRRLWRSDGSYKLWPHRLGDFAPAGDPLIVRDGQRPAPLLNELEYDFQNNLILANVFMSTKICAIDPQTGQVKFWLDARPLLTEDVLADVPAWGSKADAVLNGLAMAEDGQSLWLGGKFWNRLYQIKWPPEDMAKEK